MSSFIMARSSQIDVADAKELRETSNGCSGDIWWLGRGASITMPSVAIAYAAVHRLRPYTRGQVLLIVSAVAFSSAGFFARIAPIDVWPMVFWRNLFGSAALFAFMLVSGREMPWRCGASLGRWGWAAIAASSLATVCFLVALAHTSVADVSIIYATAPLLTALIAWVWLGERVTRRTLFSAALAFAGVGGMVVGMVGGGGLFGDALALVMTSAMALMTVFARRHRPLPALLTALLASLVAALAALLIGSLAGSSFVVPAASMAWLAAFGVVTMAAALPAYLAGAACVPAGQAMLISALEMPLGPLWVWLAFAEMPSTAALIGGAVVTVAIISQLGAE
jgi:drug/metabolite transporter (DMT)-like permease